MSRGVRLTPRGLRLLVAAAPVAALGLALRDPLLVAAAVAVWITLARGYLRLGSGLSRVSLVVVRPGGVRATLTAGDLFQEPLVVESGLGLGLELRAPLRYASVSPAAAAPGGNAAVFRFQPALSGRYESGSLEAHVVDRFGLVEGRGEVPFSAFFEVYPRVFTVAARAFEFMFMGGLSAEGELSTRLRGRSLEYAETREYVPGDPLGMFDWKATARTGAPHVKQYYVEEGGLLHVVYDGWAPDPVSLDELGAGFLGLVLSLARAGATLRLSVLEGGALRGVALGAGDALMAALGVCLGGSVGEFREYYRLIDPVNAGLLDGALGGSPGDGSALGWYSTSEASEHVVVVSSMCGDPVPLVELAAGSGGAAVLRPGAPWLWAPSLEGSVLMCRDAERRVRVLGGLGVAVYSGVEDLLMCLGRAVPQRKVYSVG